jgi:Lipopolysaccharide-assembly
MKAIFKLLSIGVIFFLSGCYSFKDVSIPPEVKTARVNYIENKASYVNPQLSPVLTDRLRQKINNQTRLTLVQNEDAHYDISCTIRNYTVTTAGVSQQQAATNRLVITIRVNFKNRLDDKASFDADISRNFDFNANLSLQQAEAQLADQIIQNLADEIFNRIFSNW